MLNPGLILQLQNQLAIASLATYEYIAAQDTVTEEDPVAGLPEDTVEAAGLSERTEDWREAPVVRDESGRFASSTTPETKETPPSEDTPAPTPINKILQEKATTFSAGLRKFERDQVGKVNQVILDRTTDRLKELADQRQELAGELVDLMFGKYAKQARQQLAELCKPINPTVANAVEEDPYQEVAADIKRLQRQASLGNTKSLMRDLPKAFQYTVAKYNKTIDDLQNATGDNAELMHAAGKVIALTVPITTFMAATLGAAAVTGVLTHAIAAAPIFAAGGAAAGAAKLATGVVVSTAAWKVKSKSVEEGLDILEVDNKLTRKLLKWTAFLAGDLGGITQALNAPVPPSFPGGGNEIITGINEATVKSLRVALEFTKNELINFAAFPAINAALGDTLAPGRDLSGKSYSQIRELKRTRIKAEATLESIKKKASDYNEQFEEAMLALQKLPDLETAV